MSIVKVAQLAGCSTATVSRVLNRRPGVSDDAAARVHEAARQLNYRPPTLRRGPQPKTPRPVSFGHVAFLLFGTRANPLAAPTAAAVVDAVETALRRQVTSMTLARIQDEDRLPSIVEQGRVDGLILHGLPPRPELARRLQKLPAVWVMTPRAANGYWGDRVAPDNAAVGRMAADYLMARGHDRIALLGVSGGHLGFAQRCAAFEETAAAAGVTCHLIDAGGPGGDDEDFAKQRRGIDALIDAFCRLTERPTGLFVPRGRAMPMVFEALRLRGLEPGRDLTVIACDNDPALAGLTPPIATIDVRPDLVGRSAVDQLMRRIETPEAFSRASVLIEPTLLEPGRARDSMGGR